MSKGNPENRFSEEVRALAVRLVLENEANYKTRSECLRLISSKIGCLPERLGDWIKKHSVEDGTIDGLSQSERAELKALKREIKELRQANDILHQASAFFAAADFDRLGKT